MMEQQSTVILSLDMYHELYDFKKNAEATGTWIVVDSIHGPTRIVTVKDPVRKIAEANSQLRQEIDELKSQTPIEKYTIEEIKKMNYWQFMKFKKKLK